MLGVELGKAIAENWGGRIRRLADLQAKYLRRQERGCRLTDLRMQLTDVDFEVGKREGFIDDPDLPAQRPRKRSWKGRYRS